MSTVVSDHRVSDTDSGTSVLRSSDLRPPLTLWRGGGRNERGARRPPVERNMSPSEIFQF